MISAILYLIKSNNEFMEVCFIISEKAWIRVECYLLEIASRSYN